MKALIVGYGRAGKRHVSLCRQRGLADAFLIVDPEVESSHLSADVIRYGSIKEALAALPHFAIIATPPCTHVAIASEVVARNVPCLIEKPLSEPGEDCEVLREADRRGVTVSVVSQHRFADDYEALKGELERGAVRGRLVVRRRRSLEYLARAARYHGASVGVGLTIGIHYIDLLVAALGKPSNVNLKSSTVAGVHVSTAGVQVSTVGEIRWAGGTAIKVDLKWGPTVVEMSDRVKFIRPQGGSFVYEKDCIHEAGRRCSVVNEELIGRQLQQFVDCVRYGGSPKVRLDDARAALEVGSLLL